MEGIPLSLTLKHSEMPGLRFSLQTLCLFISLFSVTSATTATAQQTSADPRITEAYGAAYASQLTPEQLRWIDNQLSRCEILQEAVNPSENYPAISSIPRVKKYIPQIPEETAINPQTLNPLTYAIDFHKAIDVKYRIDGTDYVLLVRKKL